MGTLAAAAVTHATLATSHPAAASQTGRTTSVHAEEEDAEVEAVFIWAFATNPD